MRKILFKAKEAKTGKWAQGNYYEQPKFEKCRYLITWNGRDALGNFGDRYHPVENVVIDEKTLSQYTGVDDVYKRKIFENDIVDLILPYKTIRCKVVFERGHFELVDIDDTLVYYISPSLDMKIVGNIFDNPKLLEEANEN